MDLEGSEGSEEDRGEGAAAEDMEFANRSEIVTPLRKMQ